MNEFNLNTVTVTIPADHYFDLKKRAEMNDMLMEKIGMYEGRLNELDRRTYALEREVYHDGKH